MDKYITITQKPAAEIRSYKIYMLKKKKFMYIGRTSDTSYDVHGLHRNRKYTFSVTSEKGPGQESIKSEVTLHKKLLPGGSGLLSVSKRDLFADNLNFGFEFGLWYASGNREKIAEAFVQLIK